MAASDPITAARQTFLEGDVAYKRSVSESVLNKFGSASNYIMERIYTDIEFTVNGYMSSSSIANGVGGIKYITRQSDIEQYYMAIEDSGNSGNTRFNVAIYDGSGVFVNNLFSDDTLQISGSNGDRVVIGKTDIQGTPTNIDINTAGHTILYGTLNLTQLQTGYVLVPFMEAKGEFAINMNFVLRTREL